MKKSEKFSFIKPTLKFCIAGIFMPGFTAVIILGLQQGIQFLGVECSISWTILWSLTAIAAVISPVIFIKVARKKIQANQLSTREIILFNLLEYTFIQCALTALATTGKTLCYVTDGQNGLEFVFTGWIAVAIIAALSRGFDLMQ